ncbi:DUF3048 domain-containing protein [Anaerosphaera multitolerans]|uniref:DUF3048 domain-containing protein n=1 Tax=Anaerosphaera multitolerans TaxID=2487351 RepID=A0A437SA86_9FIRM|nr:DUF3048 domain-containing protein [Anaerosphaera multitolerans]RVU55727.1 DUF3048 domain-containing protein [Anaerosphaera multitolerans]
MKKKIFIITLLTLLLCSCAGPKDPETPEKEVEKISYYAPLSGEETAEDISGKPVFAVMLDNHPDARPQSGLNDAEVVYEFKAEGEFTRYLALYMKNEVDVLGPVRSARPYFVDTAAEYEAIYAHWGGSEAGYFQISTLGVKNLDGIALEGITYYRNKEVNKRRPHDGYTSYESMYEKAEELNYLEDLQPVTSFKFDYSEDLNAIKEQMGDVEATKVSLDFFKHYNTTFEYTPDSNSYLVFRNGEEVVDERDSSNVVAKNIIVQFAKSYVSGPNGTLTVEHLGEGEGKLITNGKIIDITWEKDSDNSRTIFKTLSGEEIILMPGETFIEVLDLTDNVEIEPVVESEEVKESENNK